MKTETNAQGADSQLQRLADHVVRQIRTDSQLLTEQPLGDCRGQSDCSGFPIGDPAIALDVERFRHRFQSRKCRGEPF